MDGSIGTGACRLEHRNGSMEGILVLLINFLNECWDRSLGTEVWMALFFCWSILKTFSLRTLWVQFVWFQMRLYLIEHIFMIDCFLCGIIIFLVVQFQTNFVFFHQTWWLPSLYLWNYIIPHSGRLPHLQEIETFLNDTYKKLGLKGILTNIWIC